MFRTHALERFGRSIKLKQRAFDDKPRPFAWREDTECRALLARDTRCLATLILAPRFASRRVTRVLEEIITQRSRPTRIRCDNGPELTSRHFLAWCVERQVELVHI